MKYLELMRIKHYIKNFLIFVPLMFSGLLTNSFLFSKTLIGFFCFSFMSSAIYIINDIFDREKDRNHPIKKNRPLANGKISVKNAIVLCIVCCILSIGFQIFFLDLKSGICLVTYGIINFVYSKIMKHKPIIDIVLLVSGFFIRVLYGAFIAEIEISFWLYLTVVTTSFYMAFGKRRNELKINGNKSRKVLRYYTVDFLDKNMYVCMGLIITFYSLWSASKGVLFTYTIPIVMIICIKYSYDIEINNDGDPISVLLSDKLILSMVIIFAIYMLCVLYMN